MSRDSHLVPVVIHDLVIQLESPRVGENEELSLVQRLETIRDFCIQTLNRHQRNKDLKKATIMKKKGR